MGYLNEFPHVESNKLNLDWLLEQYRTFNDRIAEIQAHFDKVAEEMQQENAQYKADMLSAFNSFKDDVNEQVASISNAIEQVSDNVTEYVESHMSEWQLDAMTGEHDEIIIGNYDPEEVTSGGGLDTMVINNKEYVLGGYNWVGQMEAGGTINITLDTNCKYEVLAYNWTQGAHRFFVWEGRGVAKVSGPTTTTTVVGSVTGAQGHIGSGATMNAGITFDSTTYEQNASATINIQDETSDFVISSVGTTTKNVLIDASYVTATLNGNILTLTNNDNVVSHRPSVFIRKV